MGHTKIDCFTKKELKLATSSSFNFAGALRQLGLPREAYLYKHLKSRLKELDIEPRWAEERQQAVRNAVATSESASAALEMLGLSTFAGNHKTLKALVARWGLDTSHWRAPRGKRVRRAARKRRPLSELLANPVRLNSSRLKKRLLSEGLLENQCSWDDCPTRQMTEWRGADIKFDLDHINGNSEDNRIENLRLLCKLCHAQTETYSKKKSGPKRETPVCLGCGKVVSEHGRRCRKCAAAGKTKIEWPPAQEILDRIATSSVSAVARGLGVTGNAVRRRIKNHPPRVA